MLISIFPDIKVRNIHNRVDSSLPLRDFIAKCRIATPYRTDTGELVFRPGLRASSLVCT